MNWTYGAVQWITSASQDRRCCAIERKMDLEGERVAVAAGLGYDSGAMEKVGH